MGRARFGGRLALGAVTLAMVMLVSQAGNASASSYQHVGIVWTNYPGGYFGLHLYPTTAPFGPLGYWFTGVVFEQSPGCGGQGGFENVYGQGKATYVADATAGAAGAGTITGLARGNCGTRTFTLTFSYTGKGGFHVIHGPPSVHYNWIILQRTISATGRFCWVGGSGACASFGTTTNAVAETVTVVAV